MNIPVQFRCRSCASDTLSSVLSLGKMPLANALLSREALDFPEDYFPLELVRCMDCSLVQITETVSPQKLFSHYVYFSSFSDTMVKHAQELADRLMIEEKLDERSLVGEVASNDGYLLQHYAKKNIPVLGIEPAKNIAEVAKKDKHVKTIADFFSHKLAKNLVEAGRKLDVLHANNVLAHVADLNDVVQGFEVWLRDTGIAVIEVPYLRTFLSNVEFDTIYHEHLCYFSLTAVDKLFLRHGLHIHDVEQLAIHGGSLRLFVSKKGRRERQKNVLLLLQEEERWGVFGNASYDAFRDGVSVVRTKLRALVAELRVQGKTIAAYGASAKGATLLNYCCLGVEYIEFAADRSHVKQGKYMPGVHIPVVKPEELLRRKPDYCLLLTWNFAEEIINQQKAYLDSGGRFILPIPTPKIVASSGKRNE